MDELTKRFKDNELSKESIGCLYKTLKEVYNNEMSLFAYYTPFDENHTEYEKMAFNNCMDNMQNISVVLGVFEEIMEDEYEQRKI